MGCGTASTTAKVNDCPESADQFVDNPYPPPKPKNVIRLIPMFPPPDSKSSTTPKQLQMKDPPLFPELAPEIQRTVYGQAVELEPLARKLFDYQNVARIKPSFIVSLLEYKLSLESLKKRKKSGCAKSVYTQCISEALDELRNMPPLPPLKYSRELSLVCEETMEMIKSDKDLMDLCSKGVSPEYEERMERHEFFEGEKGETIYYGRGNSLEETIIDLIIDGTPGRDQRRKIYNPNYSISGISVRNHQTLKGIVVIFSYFQ